MNQQQEINLLDNRNWRNQSKRGMDSKMHEIEQLDQLEHWLLKNWH